MPSKYFCDSWSQRKGIHGRSPSFILSATVGPGWIDDNTFLAGYGAAQALPGPLFPCSAYLGAVVKPEPHGAAGAGIALVVLFLPGLLLVIGVLPFWNWLRSSAKTRALFARVNASALGILLAALYQPVWTSSVHKPSDFADQNTLERGGAQACSGWRESIGTRSICMGTEAG
jgi:Chromate transporter